MMRVSKMKKQKNFKLPNSRTVQAVVALSGLLIFGAMAFGARAWYSHHTPASLQSTEVRTVLGDTGFNPPEATCAVGQQNLIIENRSSLQGLTVKVMRDGGGGLVREFQVPAGSTEWSEGLNLAAGGYTLMVTNNPAWLFHITAQ